MKIAVTGASGFVGRSFTSLLDASSIDYISLDRLSSFDENPAAFDNHFYVDYSDIVSLKRILNGCDIVVHLAGRAHKPSVHDKNCEIEKFKIANIDCLINVITASKSVGVRRIIFVSSIGVLGDHTNGIPFSETSSPNPTQLYAKSKYEAELALLSSLSADNSFEWVILRPPLIYGPICPGNMAKLIKAVKVFPVLPFAHIYSVKSFISVNNFVDILSYCISSDRVVNQVFNVSDCDDLSVRDMFLCILQGLDKSCIGFFGCPPFILRVIFNIFGFGSVWRQLSSELVIDSSRFQAITGWTPPYSSREQLRLTAKSFL